MSGRRVNLTVTEPGTDRARRDGCSCPPGQHQAPYRLADDCPLHTRRHAFTTDSEYQQALTIEREREAARTTTGGAT